MRKRANIKAKHQIRTYESKKWSKYKEKEIRGKIKQAVKQLAYNQDLEYDID